MYLTLRLTSIVLVLIFTLSCKDDDFFEDDEPYPKPEEVLFTGKMVQSENDPNSFSDYQAQSAISNVNIDDNGNFELTSIKNSKFQLFMVTSKQSGEIVYYGISHPGTNQVLINDSITAIGLLLINPYLIGSKQEHRELFINQATSLSNFNKLVQAIATSRKNHPNNPLNESNHPEIFQLVNDVSSEAFEQLGSGGEQGDLKYGEKSIVIIDKAGNNVGFENHRHVFYAVDINNISLDEQKSLLLSRKDKVFTWVWWPIWKMGPKYVKAPVTTTTINDGVCSFHFNKLSFEGFGSPESEKSMATSYNLLFGIYYFLDIVVGLAEFNEKVDFKTLGIILQSSPEALEVERCIIEGETENTINAFLQLMISDVGLSIIKKHIGVNIKDNFAASTYKSFKKILGVLTALGYLNEHIPFFIDLNRGPHSFVEKYRSTSGKLEHIETNLPPEVKVVCTPSVGYGTTKVNFTIDYNDDYTRKDEAFYQWKWVPNGQDHSSIPWSEKNHNPDTLLTLSSSGLMYLKADDGLEGVDIHCRAVPFYESIDKTRIIVLSQYYNFKYGDYLFDSLNYKGTDSYIHNGTDLCHVLTQSERETICDVPGIFFDHKQLNPQTDLLVIDPSVRDGCKPVLDEYLDNKLAIMNFVSQGGHLLLINSWNVGYEEGLLPVDFVSSNSAFTYSNAYSNREFISENPQNLYTRVAFTNIPKQALVHLTNAKELPVLVEIKKGEGTILVSAFSCFQDTNDDPNHYPVNINTFRYLIGADYQ